MDGAEQTRRLYCPNLANHHTTIAHRTIKQALKISWYDPALGGTNCDHDCTTMASGTKVTPDRYGNTAACVAEWTRQRKVVVVPGIGKFQCLDTGGAIKEHTDYIWIDLLLKSPIVPFGSLIYDWYLE